MSSENESTNAPQINTGGGLAIDGDVNTGGGDFIGAQNILTEETAYNVHGLKNPYLGLRAFTYEDREIYAGRDAKVREALEKLTEIGKEQTILFVTGASGSGKSSFVKAGLLPRLREHYRKRHKQVGIAIFHPGDQPLAKLDDALSQLSSNSSRDLAAFTPADQVNLLIIDQFEEVFTQAHLAPDAEFFQWLQQAPPFQQGRTHIIATVRSDYLNELFNLERLYDLNRYGLNLRTMSIDELSETIQRPLQVKFPNGERRFEPELVQKLAKDASARSTLLPLLQVSLQSLWKKGSLKLAAYTNLTDAIQQRAEEVYAFSDRVNGDPQQQRPERDQQELIGILLDLVKVSVDDADRRDVRQPRIRYELEKGKPQRSGLIEELVTARLLAATREKDNGEDVEVIDIIHESLIDNWDRLRNAIEAQRQQLQRRARFKLWLGEWLRNERKADYLLLTDMQIAEAQALVEGRDIEVQGNEARAFYQRSLDQQETERQKELQRINWNADGRTLASGSADEKIIIWDTIRGEQTHVAQKHESIVSSVAWSPKGQILASGSDNGDIIIWNVNDMTPARTIKYGASMSPNSLTWNPDGSVLAAGNRGFSITLWNPFNGELIDQFIGHESYVKTIAWSPNGKTLASGSEDQTIIIWNAVTGKVQRKLKANESAIRTLAWSPDGHRIATGESNTIVIWEIEQEESLRILKGHEGTVTSLAWNPNGKILASGSDDHTIILWNTISNTISKRLEGHKGPVTSIAWSPDGHTLASGSNDSKIIGVDPFTLSSNDSKIILWEATSGKLLYTLEGNKNSVASVAWSPDGRMLASGGGNFFAVVMKVMKISLTSDNSIKIWNASTGELLRTFEGHQATVNSIAWSPDGRILASGSQDATVILWDMSSGRPLHTLKGHRDYITHVAWSLDGKTLAVSSSRIITLWDVQGSLLRTLIPTLNGDSVEDIAWNPDGHILASAGTDKIITFWDTDTGKPIRAIKGHTDGIYSIAWSPDGNLLASGSSDNTIQLRPRIFTEDPCHWAFGNFTYYEWITYRFTGVYHRTCSDLPEPYPLTNAQWFQKQTVLSKVTGYIVYFYLTSWTGRIIIWGVALAIFVGIILFAWWLILRIIRLFWRMITYSIGRISRSS